MSVSGLSPRVQQPSPKVSFFFLSILLYYSDLYLPRLLPLYSNHHPTLALEGAQMTINRRLARR